MTTLKDLLRTAAYSQLSDADALARFTTMVPQSSHKLWAWTDIVIDERFGKSLADAFYQAIVTSPTGGVPASQTYVNYGIDLSLDDSQDGLTAIALAVPQLATACNALKLLGQWTATQWTLDGLDVEPQLSDITAARQQIARDDWAANVINELIPQAVTAGKSISELKALVAGA